MTPVVSIALLVIFWRFFLLVAAEVFESAGLPPPSARFQARSALTGTGYTTTEAETVVRDPASRAAATMLMMIGYLGPATILALMGWAFVMPEVRSAPVRAGVLIGLLAFVAVADRFGVLARLGSRPARFVARRVFGARIDEVWTVLGDRAVATLRVDADSPLSGRELGERPFGEQGVQVLAIQRIEDGRDRSLSAPAPGQQILSGDRLILFGPVADLERLRAAAR